MQKANSTPNPHASAYFQLLTTSNLIELRLREVLQPYKITHPQFNILKILQGSFPEPLSAGAIKERMLFNGSDVTRLIDRLVNKGYVHRTVCADNRRKVDIVISEAGRELLTELHPKALAAVGHFFEEQITEADARELERILKKMCCDG
ncbi:MAG: MarR family transcriptional regulator [Bacteroidota bacterium]